MVSKAIESFVVGDHLLGKEISPKILEVSGANGELILQPDCKIEVIFKNNRKIEGEITNIYKLENDYGLELDNDNNFIPLKETQIIILY